MCYGLVWFGLGSFDLVSFRLVSHGVVWFCFHEPTSEICLSMRDRERERVRGKQPVLGLMLLDHYVPTCQTLPPWEIIWRVKNLHAQASERTYHDPALNWVRDMYRGQPSTHPIADHVRPRPLVGHMEPTLDAQGSMLPG